MKKYILLAMLVNTFSYSLQDIPNNDHKKTLLLTGAAGFIGSNFLKYMFDKYPSYNFIVLDALTYAGNLQNIPRYIKNSTRFQFHQGSVTSSNIVNKLMKLSDLVVHFAAESHVTRSIADSSIFFETDVIGTRVIMDSLVNCKNVQRFIHISTSEVYGTAEYQPMNEEHPLNPRSPYAAAKAGADRLVYSYWCTYDLPALIIRPFNNYGPNQHLEKLIPRFITRTIQNKDLTIHGDGNAKRDWIYVVDLCKALDTALHLKDFNKIKNQVINIGSGKATSINGIFKLISKNFNTNLKVKKVLDRPGQVNIHIADISKAKKLLGWTPTITLDEGIKETINWYKQNQLWWQPLEGAHEVSILIGEKVQLH